MNICILCGSLPRVYDAVGDACWRLALELAQGNRITLIVPGIPSGLSATECQAVSLVSVDPGWGIRTLRDVTRCIADLKPDVILVHFVPQLYGWNGAKPGLAALLGRLRRKGHRIITVAHEFSAPFGPSPKLMAWSAIHRLLFRWIVRASDQLVLTTAQRCEYVRRRFSTRRVDCQHIPIGSALPVASVDRITARNDIRRQYDIADSELIVATFGTQLQSMVSAYRELFRRMIAEGIEFRAIVIGKSGDFLQRSLGRDPGILKRLHVTGPVPDPEASRFLSLSDLYVVFFPDGASTRRTSLLAGLAHSIPTISNRGTGTDWELESTEAVALVDYPFVDGGFDLIRKLCRGMEHRSQLGSRGKQFHDEFHSWPRIGQEYVRLIKDAHRTA